MAKKVAKKKSTKRKAVKKTVKSTKGTSSNSSKGASPKSQETSMKPLLYVLGAIVLLFLAVSVMNSDDPSPVDEEPLEKATVPTDVLAANGVAIGSEDAPVTIIEFSDFQCPHCARAATGTVKEIKDKLVATGKVKFVFKHFPIPNHAFAKKAAEASECAAEQGKFWEMHDAIFANQNQMDVDDLKVHAQNLGMDTGVFNECLDSGKMTAKVEADLQEGIDAGVSGTPTFVVNGFLVTGAQPYAIFEELVDAVESGQDLEAAQPVNQQDDLADSSNDPAIELVVVNDPNCGICDTSQVLGLLQDKLFSTAEVREVDVNSEEGQAFVDTFNLIGIPAYIFSDDVVLGANYVNVKDAFQEDLGWHLLSQQLVGVVKMLKTPTTENGFSMGSKDAPITIVEFSDFECPFCGKFYSETYQLLKSEYVDTGKVRMVYKHFPLPSHPNAAIAAEAAQCAGDQELFWEMHDSLFENQRSLTSEKIVELATDLDLDVAAFNECMTSGTYADLVQSHMEEGIGLGITGTPSFFVNDVAVSGAVPFTVFQELLDTLVE